ncbi:MAG: putative prophage phiRv2 integrase [Pelotomaculum sp. PtaU1.Bin065]|nr:MAG: putative prophage phiRv2 integrase [Pelotomaculum sp. PtaU1.Bin065]
MRGTIIKNEGARRTTYSAMLWVTDPATGKRKQVKKTFDQRKHAEDWLNDSIGQNKKGIFSNPGKLTVKEYMERWLNTHKASLGSKTSRRYEGVVKLHIIPKLGGCLLANLTPLLIQEFIDSELTAGRKDNKKTVGKSLSGATVRYHYIVLHKALDQAVDWGLLSYNPADRVKAPRVDKKEAKIINKDEIDKLLQGLEGSYLYLPTFLGIYTGMRMGEILGLTWRDLDFTNGTINVRQSSSQVKADTPEFKEPKTGHSRRVIDITPLVVKTLKKYKKHQAKWKLAAGDSWGKFNLVCCLEDGRPINPPTLSSRFTKLAGKMGIFITFHKLRHTHASLLLQNKVPLKIVSERLGHASVGITGDIYSHVTPGLGREAAQGLEDFLKKK